ncbi:helix-turn-helix transcriptional regulator [Funiculus sociatus GB2-A5]|uniref:Helix-turn-helix transcriptional regulator n=1 Tax=Funiculus sociatus GB2-A5 TaxID=2933946 RepID=A0ABV0JKW8_9CYAN|nr:MULTISPECIES: helix-turn-helix transcriptional regulator [unclassified Trichocoleus]MBD1906274.1 helix-turn-helix transcriptional regulator [Trichocoleus sp. FACHB-832]MBD2061439.1 helix-turn-helix transcriptional regulator [Trichocoleus sp. FACHB-6]
MGFPKNAAVNTKSVLEQPEVGKLIDELGQLTNLTQGQLAEILGVAYATINRWENGHIQPSPLAIKQFRALIDQLSESSSQTLRAGIQRLLTQHFSHEG